MFSHMALESEDEDGTSQNGFISFRYWWGDYNWRTWAHRDKCRTMLSFLLYLNEAGRNKISFSQKSNLVVKSVTFYAIKKNSASTALKMR